MGVKKRGASEKIEKRRGKAKEATRGATQRAAVNQQPNDKK